MHRRHFVRRSCSLNSMIKKIRIENFKNFEEFEYDGFRQVNLIAGKNNVGKTNLLEAIYLGYRQFYGPDMRDILFRRNEWKADYAFDDQEINKALLSSFVFNRDREKEGKTVLLDFESFSSTFRVTEVNVVEKQTDIGNGKKYIEKEFVEHTPGSNKSSSGLGVGFSTAPDSQESFKLIQDFINGFSSTGKQDIYFSQSSTSSTQLADLWDKVVLLNQEPLVFDYLKLIDHKVHSLYFSGGKREAPTALVGHDDFSMKIPLKSLGDGVSKILEVIMLLVVSRNRLLLLDEIENGLHYSVQEKLWRAIFELASPENLNVQIFATTHSRDCFEAFAKVSNEFKGEGKFIRLQEFNGKIEAVDYDEKEMLGAYESDYEVR